MFSMMWGSCKRRLQSVGRIVRQYPSTIVVPLLVCALLTGIGVAVVIVASHEQAETTKQRASLNAAAAAELMSQVIHGMMQPIYSLALFIQANPHYPTVVQQFPGLAASLLAQVDNLNSSSYVQLGPMANIRHVYPENENSIKSIGLDLLGDPLMLDNLEQPPGQRLTLIGPFVLYGEKVLAMIGTAIVFIPNVMRNETFGMPSSIPRDCPPSTGDVCYDETTRSKLWGIVCSIIYFESFVTGPSAALSSLRQQGYNYMVVQKSKDLPPTPGVTGPDGAAVTVLARSDGNLTADPVIATISVESVAFFVPFTLMITASSGEWEPSWKTPMLATVVVVAAFIGVLLFVLLLYMRQHQILLFALMPRKMVKSMFQGEAFDAIAKGRDLSRHDSARMLHAGTPVEKLMDLLSDLMDGKKPEMRDVIALRAVFLHSGTLFQPQDLRGQLRQNEALEDDVVNALVRELQGLSPDALPPAFALLHTDSSHRFLVTPTEGGVGTMPWALNFIMSYPGGEDAAPTPTHSALVPMHSGCRSESTAGSGRASILGKGFVRASNAALIGQEQDSNAESPVASVFVMSTQSAPSSQATNVPFVTCLQASPADQVLSILETSYGSWTFDAFELCDATEGHPLSTMFFFLVSRSGLMREMKLNPSTVARLSLAIEEGYCPNPYHNKIHAADVLQTMHAILVNSGMVVAAGQKGYCPPETLLACLLAAAGHDIGHTGVTNDFLVHSEDDLATLYSDKSPMEHFHLASLFRLLKKKHLNILGHFTKEDRIRIRKVVIELVSATDMKNHISTLSQFSTMHQLAKDSQKSGAPPRDLSSLKNLQQGDSAAGAQVPADDAQQMISLQAALKCADLGNIAKQLEVTCRWTSCLEEEFFAQGDRERSLGLPISPLFDRCKPGVSKSQTGFYDFVVLPLFHNFCCAFPGVKPMVDLALSNYKHWKSKSSAPEPTAAAAAGAPSAKASP